MRALNKGTELDNPLELSLHERMNLQLKSYSNLMTFTGIIIIVIFALGVCSILFYLENVSDMIEPVEGFHNVFFIIFGCIISFSGIGLAWLLINVPKEYKENNDINRDYTHQAYLLALSVYGREGEADLDFYEIARDVFPELKKLDIESIEKSGEAKTPAEKLIMGSKKDEYVFDIVTETDQGKFIIKHFKEKAVYADLERCLNIVRNEGWGDMLRLVCLAEDFDSDILKNYESLAGGYPLDLILYNEKGFSALKISN